MAGLLPGSNIGDTKTWSVTNNYYFSNYPEKGHGPGLDGQILWRTEEAVTGNVAIGFNHKNIGTSGATLKLLVSPAPTSNRPSVGWAELFSMCDAEASSLAMGRLVIEEDERARISSNLPTIAVGNSGVWIATNIPMAEVTEGDPVSTIGAGQVVTGLMKLNITGSVFLGLSIWTPSGFPSALETPADQLMRSRRRGRVEAKQMSFALSKTSFNWIGDPTVQGMGDGDAHFWTSFVGMGSPPNLDWDTTTTPNETWMVIDKVEMPNGDNEHWGDYMVKVSCSPITLTNTTPDKGNLNYLLALVPLDDVGIGWTTNDTFTSSVAIRQNLLINTASGSPFNPPKFSVPFNGFPNAAKSTLEPGVRGAILLAKGTLSSQESTKTIALEYAIPNGSAGWFALILLARKVNEAVP